MKSIILAVLAANASPSPAAVHGMWPDSLAGRLAVLAEMQALNAELLSNASATLTLDRWCVTHNLAKDTKIVADRVTGAEKLPSDEIRSQLHVEPGERIAYRRVRLRCGGQVLSEADNWYVPSRLTASMNDTLESTNEAFGRVVQPLHFQRRTVSAKLLWSPLPENWDTGKARLPTSNGRATLSLPDNLIEHQALLTRGDGNPFSFVVETYTGAVLNFPPPPGL